MGYEENSNSNDAWMDHRNQTNPFLTAREVALAEQNNPHKDPFRNRSGDGPSRSNYQNARQQQPQNAHNNPYGYEFQGGPSDPPDNNPHDGDARAASSRGPFIPDSLKRKFQRPKRGLGSLTQTSKAAGQRSHLWPSSSSNPNGAKNSYHPTNSNHVSSQRPPAASGGDQIGKRSSSHESKGGQKDEDDELPEELQHLDKELVKKIQNEIMESGDTVTFDDIAGLEDAKATVQEVVCWPMKRPDLFTGLRRAPNGLLLYGPPG
jgi:SpoVK/Ycf46/Vps4 family AAA+-type ATPase